MDPITFRFLERILDVGAGGLSIVLGYRLFFHLPQKTDGTGKIILPGNISVYVSRVGPGIFFAMFGAAVIALSLHSAISFTPARADGRGVEFSGISATADAAEHPAGEMDRARLRPEMATLNTILPDLKQDLPAARRVQIEQAIPRVKLGLMRGVWAADWGDSTAFERWMREGPGTPPPAGLERAAEYYLYSGGR
ncbi:MAG TPA: hypothetical protein VGF16_03995 [Bryobacteraceae bacterium]|jgi:hypothetical protein